MALVETAHGRDLDALDDATTREEAVLRTRTARSHDCTARGLATSREGSPRRGRMPPCPVFLERGRGSRVWDVDGTEYVDMHAGFGASSPGTGTRPSHRRDRSGRSWEPTSPSPWPDLVPVAAELARRFGLPLWRFTNSGTESTPAAIHHARATGRTPPHQGRGLVPRPPRLRAGLGLPRRGPLSALRRRRRRGPASTAPCRRRSPRSWYVVPSGVIDAVRRVLLEHPGEIAGMIVEPVMMNIGVVPPPPGYLDERVTVLHQARCPAHVRRGEDRPGPIVPGGATECFGVVPDIVCLAKALGGGVPCGAIGARPRVMELIAVRCLRAGRHVQRQPADDGGRQGDAARGPHPGGLAPASTTLREELVARARRRPPTVTNLSGYVEPVRRQGRHRVLAGARSATTATSAATTPATATGHWRHQTTAACSSRRGGRWSSGRCRSSTGPMTSPSSSPTSSASPPTCRADGPRTASGRVRTV